MLVFFSWLQLLQSRRNRRIKVAGVDRRPDAQRLGAQFARLVVGRAHAHLEVGLPPRQIVDPPEVEHGDRKHKDGEPGQRSVHGTFVVERAGREVDPSIHGPRVLGVRAQRQRDAQGWNRRLHGARRPGRAGDGRDRPARVDYFSGDPEAFLNVAPHLCGERASRRTADDDTGEAAAAETILVVHRRLMDQFPEVAVAVSAAMTEEDHVVAPENRQ